MVVERPRSAVGDESQAELCDGSQDLSCFGKSKWGLGRWIWIILLF